jgi:dTDP-4-amino-4,6-dideoxygalactose transaminase
MVALREEGIMSPSIPLIRPVIGEEEAEAARRPLLSGWVTQGPEVAAFEKEFAEKVGAKHACAVSNCTAALHLALLAVGVEPGDEVITVSHTFVATANAIRYCGALPVFVDIDPATYNIDPKNIESAVSSSTKAILIVHQMGMPCDINAILEVAKLNDLPVVEDAACAVGSQVRLDGGWEYIGVPHGDIATFSFHPRKLLTTGDGGMLTTNNRFYDERFRSLRQHAMSVPDTARHGSPEVLFESYGELGYNYRMTDIQAAIGREQLKRLPQIVDRRRALAENYLHLLGSVPELMLPHEPEWARSNWQSFCVKLPSSVEQKKVMQKLLDDGIATRRGIMCIHREPAYDSGSWRCVPSGLSYSESAQAQGVILPLHHEMTEEDQQRVASALMGALCG